MLSRRSFLFQQSRLFATKHRHTRNSYFYEVLGIPSTASQTQIKEAYIKLSKQHHPDVSDSEDSKLQFQLIVDAYNILGNIPSRRMYDRGLISGATSALPAKHEEEKFNPFKLPPKPVKSDLDKEVLQRYVDITEQRRYDNQLREGARKVKKPSNESGEVIQYETYRLVKEEERKDFIHTAFIWAFFSAVLVFFLIWGRR